MNKHRLKTISETQKAINNLLMLNAQSSNTTDIETMRIAIAQGILLETIDKALATFKKETE